jgi:hypothetical protein
MNESSENPSQSSATQNQELFSQLGELADMRENPRWRSIADNPAALEKVITEIRKIAEEPNTQVADAAQVEAVFGNTSLTFASWSCQPSS